MEHPVSGTRQNRVWEQASGDDTRLKPFLGRDPRGAVGALSGTANHTDLAVPRQCAEPRLQLVERGVDSFGDLLYGALYRLADVQQNPSGPESQWVTGMSPRSTSAATIPAKLIGSYALHSVILTCRC